MGGTGWVIVLGELAHDCGSTESVSSETVRLKLAGLTRSRGYSSADRDLGSVLVLDAQPTGVDNADRMEGVGKPPARELLAKLRDHAVPVFV